VERLRAAVVKVFEDPEMKELWFKLGAEPGGASPEEFRELVARDVAKWARVVKDAKVVVE